MYKFYLIIFLFSSLYTIENVQLKKKVIINQSIYISDLLQTKTIFSKIKLSMESKPGYYYYTRSEIIKIIKKTVPAFSNFNIIGDGIELFIQKGNIENLNLSTASFSPNRIKFDEYKNSSTQIDIFDENSDKFVQKTDKLFIFPHKFSEYDKIPPGTRVTVEHHLLNSTITLFGTLQNRLKFGVPVKIKLDNSENIIQEIITKNITIFK